MPIDASAITSKTTAEPRKVAANTSTPEKTTGATGADKGLANLKGPELKQTIDKLIGCVKADGCQESKQMLTTLAMNNTEAKDVLTKMASSGDDPKTSQVAKEILQTTQTNETTKMGRGLENPRQA